MYSEIKQIADLLGLGVGGVLGLIMFILYRQDRKLSEDRLAKLAADFKTIVEENTIAITMLKEVISKYGKLQK
jgi:hypothetical protein